MAAYPDVKVTGVKPLLGSDSWDTTVQFVVGLEIGDEGATGSFMFWLEFDSADYSTPTKITEDFLVEQPAAGRYAIEVPPEATVLPRYVFETAGGYLRVCGHYMPPDGSRPIDVLVLTYAITTDEERETFRLKSLGTRGANPADVRPPAPNSAEEGEPSEDEGGFVVGRDSESDDMEGMEEESAPAGSESLGEEDEDEEGDEEDEEKEGDEELGGKRDRDDDDADLPTRKRARYECANCLRNAALMCGRCRTTYYCNKDCQVAHYGAHALTCY
jgi:hypothetical protein